jgi:dihydrofolate reductase
MIHAIFAVDHNGGMGLNGSLPWPHNAEDMANFKRLTNGQVVVMGSKTWLDPKMPKPLPGRIVYVASSKPTFYAQQIQGDIKEQVLAIEERHADKNICIIGGPALIQECLPLVDVIYLTHLKGSYKVDTRIDLKSALVGWVPVRAQVSSDFSFVTVKYENLFKRPARGS